MKKFVFGVVLIGAVSTACSPSKIFLVNSEGILTYNRMTGQLEVIWETKAKTGEAAEDTTKLDSVLTIR